MNAILFLALAATAPTPIPARVDGPIELSALTIAQANALHGTYHRFIIEPASIADEHEGQTHFDAWHRACVHCFIWLVPGQDMPDAERFPVEGVIRVWDVPPCTINGKPMPGWTMIRVEDSTPLRRVE